MTPPIHRCQGDGGGGLKPIYVYFFAWPDGSHQISGAPRHQRSSSPSVLAPDQQPRPPFFAPAGEDHCSRRAGASSPPPIQIDKWSSMALDASRFANLDYNVRRKLKISSQP
jgi:hypothetical protein